MNANNPETDPRRDRVAIWSVLEEDQRWYSWLFPGLWLAGSLYHAYLRFRIEPESHILLTVGEFTKDLGIIGLAAAVVALMVIAGRRFIVALFDWGNREKTLERGRVEGRAEAQAEERAAWTDWLRRRDEAIARGEDFTEPSPADREKESQVA